MKTIFVTLPIGLSVRNILFTGVLDRLIARGDVRVIAISAIPNLGDRYPRPDDNLIFEELPPRRRRTVASLFNYMLNLRFNYLNDDPSLTSIKEKRRWLRLAKPRQFLFESLLCRPFPKSRTLYRWLSLIHHWRAKSTMAVREMFEKYRPSLMFATYPTAMNEFDFLKYARDEGIATVGLIHSWDVLTTEGQIVVPLDHSFVWNEVMRTELNVIHGVPKEKISVTGIPQFDVYAEILPPNGKEEFLRQQGLDPEKLTVLFATSAGGLTPEEPEILARLVSAINAESPGKVQFLVRIHQQDNINRYGFITEPNVKYQVPGVRMENLVDWRLMDKDDLDLLRDTLAYSDVVVNTASTISIDAIALGKPVVNIAFDLYEQGYYRSVKRIFNTIHFQLVVNSKSSKLAESVDELVSLTQRYLANPELEQTERTAFAEAMCHKVDGKSAERIASFLLDALDGKIARRDGLSKRMGQ